MSDAELIRRAGEGEEEAIRALYDRHAPRVYAVARRIAGDDHLAQDFAQEAWIRIVRALPTFRGEARFSTWLHRVATNTAISASRRSRTREERREPMPEQLSTRSRTGDVLLAKRLEEALDHLPEGMRRVLVLHDVEGYTHREIGELLGVSDGTSKSQLSRARARMREWLSERVFSRTDEGSGGREAWSI